MRRIIMAVSGGLDSTVLAYDQLDKGHFVLGVPFHYGSKHNPMEGTALEQLRELNLFRIMESVNLEDIYAPIAKMPIDPSSKLTKSSLLKGTADHSVDIPEGHYEEETMRSTVVPGRNLIFISVLAAYAEAFGYDTVCLGVHAGDHFIYPDCRAYFIQQASHTVYSSTDGKISVIAPFLEMKKVDIVRRGLQLDVPFKLTRTCYSNMIVACGKCGSCQERLEAFELNDKVDPIAYKSRQLMKKINVE